MDPGEKMKEILPEKPDNEVIPSFGSHVKWIIWQNFGCENGPVHSFALLDYSKRE